MLAGKRHAALHHLAIVVVVTKDKSAVDRQPVFAKAGQTVRVATAGQVPALAHVAEIGRIKRFHADEYAATAALDHQFQQLLILGDVNAGLPDPVDVQRDQFAA